MVLWWQGIGLSSPPLPLLIHWRMQVWYYIHEVNYLEDKYHHLHAWVLNAKITTHLSTQPAMVGEGVAA